MQDTTKKRMKTTLFWSGLTSAIIIFAQSVATLFGYSIPEQTVVQILACANSLLAILSFCGVLVNPEGVDSFQAMMSKKDSIKMMMSTKKKK